MKKMITNQIASERIFCIKRYDNDQLAVFIHDNSGKPIAELSIMYDSVELAPNEFILKDYSENKNLAQNLIDSQFIIPTNRFILIGSHLCPICQINS